MSDPGPELAFIPNPPSRLVDRGLDYAMVFGYLDAHVQIHLRRIFAIARILGELPDRPPIDHNRILTFCGIGQFFGVYSLEK